MRFAHLSVLLGSLAVTVSACSSANDGQGSGGQATSVDGFSYFGENVKTALTQEFPQELGGAWGWSTDNQFTGNWMLQMPYAEYWGTNELPYTTDCDPSSDANCDPDFLLEQCSTDDDCVNGGRCQALQATVTTPGESANKLCISHSDEILDELYGVITSAKSRVDVSSLSPPDGRYAAALRNAVTYVSQSSTPPVVRMVFGNYPGELASAQKTMQSMTRDVDSKSGLQLVVGTYRDGLTSWNHSKIVAADGQSAIEGGMNMWTKDYLDKDPVHDLSIHVKGSAAADAERFLNRVWDFVCTDMSVIDNSMVATFGGNGKCAADYPAAGTRTNEGGVPVIGVGRLGAIGAEPSDAAIVAVIDAAKTSIHIAQQDIGPPKELGISLAAWPDAYLQAIVRAVSRGVDVRIVVSNLHSTPSDYGNGWTPADVANHILQEGKDNPENWTSSEDITAAMCERLHVVGLASSSASAWPDGGKLALHTKMLLVDGQGFYVGSQNMYIANLAEFGFVVDDKVTATSLETNYYANLWQYSGASWTCPF